MWYRPGGFFRLIIKTFDEGSDVVEINVWHTITNSEGETYDLLDVGPDIYYVQDGQLHLAITGRSITGSGWIGQVVINLETGEVVSKTGLFQGDWVGTSAQPWHRAYKPLTAGSTASVRNHGHVWAA